MPHARHNGLGQTTAASSSVPCQKDMQGVSVCVRHASVGAGVSVYVRCACVCF
jgi:hypothetical protein